MTILSEDDLAAIEALRKEAIRYHDEGRWNRAYECWQKLGLESAATMAQEIRRLWEKIEKMHAADAHKAALEASLDGQP